jgi:GNAT superfamily N-acetyltransferase
MTGSAVARRVDTYWASYFGIRVEDLAAPRTTVVSHAVLQGYDGALVFRCGPACIVSVPESVPEVERRKLREARPDEAFDPEFLAGVFVVSAEKVSGPAWVGVADPAEFRPAPSSARILGGDDEAALERLAEGCGETWKQSKLVLDLKPMFGRYESGEIVAASGYRTLGVLAYIGVITHPAHRGKGHAKTVVSAAMEHAFGQDLVPLWRTPEANASAVALGKSLGFRPYASTLDVQLVEDEF